MSELLSAGQGAPEFTTQNQRGESISLSDFRGQRVLLYFYPKAMTPGCTTQACALRDEKEAFAQRGCAIIGISPDAPERLAKFDAKHELNFTLLSDEDHAIAEAFGVWQLKKFMGKEYMGVVRTSFVIDANGTIETVLNKVKTKTHHQDALNAID